MGRAARTFLLLMLLAGCTTGRDFAKPTAEAVTLGATTRAEIVAKYGEPLRQSMSTVSTSSTDQPSSTNPFELAMVPGTYAGVGYSFSTRMPGLLADTTNSRSMSFALWNDKLVAYNFISNFSQDTSNFDETKVQSLQKGKMSKADVVAMLGQPTGRAIYPFVQKEGEEKFV